MQDFFYGFVRNYHSFQISPESNNTKWTNKILGFYDQLGTLLGTTVEYEWKRYDLCWFWKDQKEPWLHVEHENDGSWEALEDTLRKVNDSTSEDIIVIVYPATEELWDQFLKELNKSQKSWTKGTDILAILDATIFQTKLVKLEGHVYSKTDGNFMMQAMKKVDEEGVYYAILQ